MSFNDLTKKEAAARQASQLKDPKEQAAMEELHPSEVESINPSTD